MHKQKINKLLLLSMFAAPISVSAGESGLSLNVGVGTSTSEADNTLQTGPNGPNSPTTGFEVDSGSVYSLGLTYDLGNGLSVQAELREREFETDTSALPANPEGIYAGNVWALDGKVESTSFFVNVIYEFDQIGALSPYVKGGIGISKNDTTASQVIEPLFTFLGPAALAASACQGESYYCLPDGETTEFSWAVGAGVQYDLSDRVALGLDYQYVDLGEAATAEDPFGDKINFNKLASHEFSLNLLFSF